MGILSLWREERGAVMRKEFHDAMARMRDANEPTKGAFLKNVYRTHATLELYEGASEADRRAILKQSKENASVMRDRGDWPSALGLAVSCLNVESRFVPGADADYVRVQTEAIIKEAADWWSK